MMILDTQQGRRARRGRSRSLGIGGIGDTTGTAPFCEERLRKLARPIRDTCDAAHTPPDASRSARPTVLPNPLKASGGTTERHPTESPPAAKKEGARKAQGRNVKKPWPTPKDRASIGSRKLASQNRAVRAVKFPLNPTPKRDYFFGSFTGRGIFRNAQTSLKGTLMITRHHNTGHREHT
jgi:hypothetical protein